MFLASAFLTATATARTVGSHNGFTATIADAVLAWLRLTPYDGQRAWKAFDWDVMDRLYRKGMIDNPANKAKSVVLSEDGLKRSDALFRELFTRSEPAWPAAGLVDTEIRCFREPEGQDAEEKEFQPRVQA